jgi:hypothetical protein
MILDFHTHVFPSDFREDRSPFFSGESAFESIYRSPRARLAGVHELLNHMDEEEVEKSVIFGFPWEIEDHYRRHNDYILEAVNRHPARLIGFCTFSSLSAGAAEETERCLHGGLSGVGELAVYGTGFSNEVIVRLKEVMGICSDRNVPVLVHTNEPVGHLYPGKAPMTLHQIYTFLQSYPLNRIVLAHWGGGIFFYGLMKREVKEVLRNVWVDTAASPFLYTPEIYRIAGEILGFERILFGSDYPLLKPPRYFQEIASVNLPPRAFDLIAGENAAALLGLNP